MDTKPPIAQRLCWIGSSDPGKLIQCWLLGMTDEGVEILVGDRIPSPCTFFLTSDRKVSRRCIVKSRDDDHLFLTCVRPE